LLKES